jgi:phosphonate metabolism-associated iron-containing alcohol dehydrogenase
MSIEKWAHYNPVRIHFGRGCRASLAEVLAEQRALIVCSPRGRQQLESDTVLGRAIHSANSIIWMDAVETNPDLDRLQELTNDLQAAHLDCVVAFGGGSAIDSAKAFALALSPMARNRSLRELLGAAASLPVGASLPLYAVPTTAGTGSEVTPYATVWDHGARRKLSLAGKAVYPHSAFVDSELNFSVPYNSTLYTGLDAINQAAESIWNRNMTPMSEILAHRALKKGMSALPRLLDDLENPNLRDTVAEVSLLAGLAISQTRTSLCHAISYPLTAHFGVPHGLACAFTMPAVLRHNLSADDGRFRRLAKILSSEGSESNEELINLFDKLNEKLQVAKQVREIVSSVDLLTILSDEMSTLGRSDNALANFNDDVLKHIICEAWKS